MHYSLLSPEHTLAQDGLQCGWVTEPAAEEVLLSSDMQDVFLSSMCCVFKSGNICQSHSRPVCFVEGGQNLLFELFRGGLFTAYEICQLNYNSVSLNMSSDLDLLLLLLFQLVMIPSLFT